MTAVVAPERRPEPASGGDLRSHPLTGTRHLVRLALRRDRIRLPVWLLSLAAVTGTSANAVAELYDTPQKRQSYAATAENSAITRLMTGIPRDTDTTGGIISYEITALAGIVVSLMVIFLVVRHTRAEEESGNAELVRSTVVGRHAAIAATLAVALGASLTAGLLELAVLVATGVPFDQALLFGAGLAGLGLVFTAVAAASAQVTASARGALGIAGAVLALLYVVRGIGAVDETAWTWLSPFGWQDELRPFGDEARAWPLLLMLGLAAATFALAVWLAGQRDFGAGLVQGRAGRERAASWLGTPVGLAWRQQRGLFRGWATGLVLLAAVYGAFANEVRTMVEGNPELTDMFVGQMDDLVLGYFGFVMNFVGITVGAFTVASALRLHHAEAAGQAEYVLATGVSRTRWALAGITVTTVTTLVMLVLVGVVAGAAHAQVTGDAGLLGRIVGAALVTAPASLVLAGVVFALHGWVPRWVYLAWAPLGWSFVQAYLGELLDLPAAVAGLSPYWHLPLVPAESFEAGPVLVLSGLAVLLAALGVAGLRRRDLD